MSLINQMLKDLEQRGAGSNDIKRIIPAKFMTTSQKRKSIPMLIIISITLLLMAGAYVWMQSKKLASPTNAAIVKTVKTEPAPISAEPKLSQQAETPELGLNTTEIESVAQINDQPHTYSPSPPVETDLLLTRSISTSIPTKTDSKNIEAPIIDQEKKTEPIKLNSPQNQNSASIDNRTKPKEPSPATASTTTQPPTKSSLVNSNIVKNIRPDQKSDNYFRQALSNLQQGRVSEAQANLTQALESDPTNHEARQTLASLLLDNKRQHEAKVLLASGLSIAPEQNNFRIALARLQVEESDSAGALTTLEQGLAYGKNNPDFQSFLAAMLQRTERHEEAISHYIASLSLNPTSANSTTNTLIGLGISLQAVDKLNDAKQAFTRAQKTSALSPELSIFVAQRLKQINQHLNQ